MIEKKLESYIKFNIPEHNKTGNTSKTKEILEKAQKSNIENQIIKKSFTKIMNMYNK